MILLYSHDYASNGRVAWQISRREKERGVHLPFKMRLCFLNRPLEAKAFTVLPFALAEEPGEECFAQFFNNEEAAACAKHDNPAV